MRLDGLLNRISDADISSVSLADPHCEVHNVSFLTTGDDNQLREDVLYFCDSELLPLHVCDARLFKASVSCMANPSVTCAARPPRTAPLGLCKLTTGYTIRPPNIGRRPLPRARRKEEALFTVHPYVRECAHG
jgi:hypothetical protein